MFFRFFVVLFLTLSLSVSVFAMDGHDLGAKTFDELDLSTLVKDDAGFEKRSFSESLAEILEAGITGMVAAGFFMLPAVFYILWRGRHDLLHSIKNIKNSMVMISRKKIFRIAVSSYLGWFCTVMLTNGFNFENVFNFEYYDPVHFTFLLLVPPILAFFGFRLIKWCRRGQ